VDNVVVFGASYNVDPEDHVLQVMILLDHSRGGWLPSEE
jgi:hypothetical protein